jgi:steroid delta-isomerase
VAFATGAKIALSGDVRCAGNAAAFPFKVLMEGVDISPIDVFEFNAEGKVQSMKAYWG